MIGSKWRQGMWLFWSFNFFSITALSDPPTNLTAVSKDPFSMYLTWLPPPKVHQVVNISGYYVFYREYSSSTGQWQIAGVPGVNSSSFNLTDLKAFTKYRLRMTLAVKVGNGPGSQEVVASTIEGGKLFGIRQSDRAGWTIYPPSYILTPTNTISIYLKVAFDHKAPFFNSSVLLWLSESHCQNWLHHIMKSGPQTADFSTVWDVVITNNRPWDQNWRTGSTLSANLIYHSSGIDWFIRNDVRNFSFRNHITVKTRIKEALIFQNRLNRFLYIGCITRKQP